MRCLPSPLLYLRLPVSRGTPYFSLKLSVCLSLPTGCARLPVYGFLTAPPDPRTAGCPTLRIADSCAAPFLAGACCTACPANTHKSQPMPMTHAYAPKHQFMERHVSTAACMSSMEHNSARTGRKCTSSARGHTPLQSEADHKTVPKRCSLFGPPDSSLLCRGVIRPFAAAPPLRARAPPLRLSPPLDFRVRVLMVWGT